MSSSKLSVVVVLAVGAALTASAPRTAAANSFTTEVLSDGEPLVLLVAYGAYTITATGTYEYRAGQGTADAAYSWDPTYGDCYDYLPSGNHDLVVDGVSPWTSPCDASTHTYSAPYSCAVRSGCTVLIWIQDDYYEDNSGSLTVTIEGPSACSDGFDNDGDSLADYPLDLGCASREDDDEMNHLACVFYPTEICVP